MSTNMQYTKTDLYGGALTVDLPTGYLDASNVRPVPENQEVWTSPHNPSGQDIPISIIFDICESLIPEDEDMKSNPDAEDIAVEDEAALDTHFADILEEGDVASEYERDDDVSFKALGRRGHEMVAKVRRRDGSVFGIGVLVLRLKEKETDFVVTVNVGDVAGMGVAKAIRRRICESLMVCDWGLFVTSEDLVGGN